jgi:hypothetical protein
MTQPRGSAKLLFDVIAICIVVAAVFVGLNLQSAQTLGNTETPNRESSIPAGAVKMTLETDLFPPFLTQNGNELWFTRTYMGSPAIYRSTKVSGGWQEPERIISQFAGKPSLDNSGNILHAPFL